MPEKPPTTGAHPLAEQAGYYGAAAFHLAGRIAGGIIDSAARVVRESVTAFQREVDPNIEDAKILDETDEAD